jgi:N-acetylglucosaminyldiphosphoundecaprenol N-acetyl-beta-D-mannosaminyltransferase
MDRKNVLGTLVSLCTYDTATELIIEAARAPRPFAVAAQPVHGITTAWLDRSYGAVLNAIDLVAPDGQPVRWALNLIHRANLTDRVYGPFLTLSVCAAAEREGLPVFLYGTTDEVLEKLRASLRERHPKLTIAGTLAPPFRPLTEAEESAHVQAIRDSGAKILFVGLGCPRQERWVLKHREALGMPALAVGAAFDFISGNKAWAPRWMQDRGLEWLFRLVSEPRRLAGRYLLLNPLYVFLIALQALGVRFRAHGPE